MITRIILIAGILFSVAPGQALKSARSACPALVKRLAPSPSLRRPFTNVASPSSTYLPATGAVDQTKDLAFMKLALRHAQHAFREKEVPIGAVVVDDNGKVLSACRNRVEFFQDATAHAEILALRRAANLVGNWRLLDCTLYTTLEPCAMCMGAAQSFRIKRLVYAAKDHRLGACGSWTDLVNAKHPFQAVDVGGGILQDEASNLMKRFFQQRRRENEGLGRRDGNNNESENEKGTGEEGVQEWRARGASYENGANYQENY